jgi:hypothetical protein
MSALIFSFNAPDPTVTPSITIHPNDDVQSPAPEEEYDGAMNTPTREEFEAKLETIEARMDGRVAAIQASIDGFMGRMEERSLRMDERFQRTDERFARIEEGQRETQASLGSLKTTIITTAIATVIAIVLGVAAFNATVLSNMVASFESGKNTAATQAEVKKQVEETAALLKQVQQQLEDSRKGPPVAPQK